MHHRHSSRRQFLKQAGAVSIGFVGLQAYLATGLSSCHSPDGRIPTGGTITHGYGPLLADPDGLLNLPSGFSYTILAKSGDKMSDGYFHPGKPDGMAAFADQNGQVLLVRNHELLPWQDGPFGKSDQLVQKDHKPLLYDTGLRSTLCQGGTTTLVIDEENLQVKKSFLSLGGTIRNCAGGPTPWNSWITCEETVMMRGERGLAQNHGYNFEVPATNYMQLHQAIPLRAMGRFNHEAVCVDPTTSIVYQTEDRDDGLIYRFLPNQPGNLAAGGRLQALSVKDQKSVDTRNWKANDFPLNEALEIQWLDIEQVESPDDNLRYQGYNKGAARFARAEGMWFGNDAVYFACTTGGRNKNGQVFRYVPSQFEGTAQEKSAPSKMELYLEPNNTALLRRCDNLTIAPWGDVVLCEDNDKPYIVGVTAKGNYYRLAENIGFESEFAGGVFSPSGKTFFVNIQHAGLTIAIQGPWEKRLDG